MPPEPTARDKAQRLVDEATERLVTELKAGKSEALREYLAAMGRFHRYSWTNTLLIQSQRPTATRVAGYHTWRDLGRSVLQGEKGIVIFAPVVGRQKGRDSSSKPAPEPILGESGARETKSESAVGFRAAYVFDVTQTVGKSLSGLTRTEGNPGEFLNRLKELVAQRGIALAYFDSVEAMSRAEGFSTGGQIKLREGLEPAEEFSVLAHELAHELLHHGPDRREFSKTVRETQAEAVAFVVSRGVGLETNSSAADYIRLCDGDVKTLTESLTAIQRTSSEILRNILPGERSIPERSVEHLVERSPEALTPCDQPRPAGLSLDQVGEISPER